MPFARVVNGPPTLYDSFSGSGALNSAKWDTYEDGDTSSDLTITQSGGRYSAAVGAGDADTTEWFNTDQGRLDYVTFSGDFDFIARNIGIDAGVDTEYQFCGVMVWLSSHNYEFAVCGQRGSQGNTIECKITDSGGGGDSEATDLGSVLSAFKSDIRVTRVGSTVRWYRQAPGTSPDSWTEITSTFDGMTKSRIAFGTDPVRVGLVTYGFLFVTAFTGECDQVEIAAGTPS